MIGMDDETVAQKVRTLRNAKSDIKNLNSKLNKF